MQTDATTIASDLEPAEIRDLRCIAGMMIPASTEYDVPGADDAQIFADILASLGRDVADLRLALAALRQMAGGAFADLGVARREAVAEAFRASGGIPAATLGRVVLQCYYRDDRVVRSLGLEPRAPFPKGHVLEHGAMHRERRGQSLGMTRAVEAWSRALYRSPLRATYGPCHQRHADGGRHPRLFFAGCGKVVDGGPTPAVTVGITL
jgi:hypothetical protein